MNVSIILLLLSSLCPSSAFLTPQSQISHPSRTHHLPAPQPITNTSPITHQRRNTALPSLFGLGPGELAIVALAGLLVIGPSKLSEMSRQAGQELGKAGEDIKQGAQGLKDGGVPEEWKAIPEEFRKGVEEGEIEARGRKAKVMDGVDED